MAPKVRSALLLTGLHRAAMIIPQGSIVYIVRPISLGPASLMLSFEFGRTGMCLEHVKRIRLGGQFVLVSHSFFRERIQKHGRIMNPFFSVYVPQNQLDSGHFS